MIPYFDLNLTGLEFNLLQILPLGFTNSLMAKKLKTSISNIERIKRKLKYLFNLNSNSDVLLVEKAKTLGFVSK